MDEFCKRSFIFTGLDSEVTVVFVVSGLKWTVRDTNVLHFTVLGCTWLLWADRGSSGLYCTLQACSGLDWAVLDKTGLH